MIIVKILGGLGNQLFQYAFGRALSYRKGIDVYFDIEQIRNKYDLRNYSLQHFNTELLEAPHEEILKLNTVTNKIWHKIYRATSGKLISKNALHYYSERGTMYDETPFLLKYESIYINGYWQSEKYFDDIQQQLRDELQFNNQPDEKNLKMAGLITSQNSISLHVRRGDYISNPSTKKIYHQCGLEYYQKAMENISRRIENPVFFVFSDDMEWVKANLKSKYKLVFVDINTDGLAVDDMRLISYCKHNIIANSTFSWWGAWLNSNPDKIIIAPEKWFVDDAKKTTDLIPSNWTRL